jgi:hypothetical protein
MKPNIFSLNVFKSFMTVNPAMHGSGGIQMTVPSSDSRRNSAEEVDQMRMAGVVVILEWLNDVHVRVVYE